MDSRTLRRWALYAFLVVMNILILVSAFGGKVSQRQPVRAKDLPTPSNSLYLPLVNKAPEPVTLLGNSTSFVESEADQQVLHLVGEVNNQSGKNAENILIAAKLLDSKDNLLGEVQGKLSLRLLPNGASSCFDLAVALPEGFERYELTLGGFELTEGDEQAVNSYVTNARFDRDFGWYAVNGVATYEVGNISGDVAVAATYYDKQKRVVGCEQTFASFPDSEVPEPGVFSFYFMGTNAFKVVEAQTLAVNVPPNQ